MELTTAQEHMEPGVKPMASVSVTLGNLGERSDLQGGVPTPLGQNQFQLQHNWFHKVQETPRDRPQPLLGPTFP